MLWLKILSLNFNFPALIRRYDDLPATITHVTVAAVLVLNTPDDGHLRPKHVEWPCRNKTCTVLHQVGVSFDLYSPYFCVFVSRRDVTFKSTKTFLPAPGLVSVFYAVYLRLFFLQSAKRGRSTGTTFIPLMCSLQLSLFSPILTKIEDNCNSHPVLSFHTELQGNIHVSIPLDKFISLFRCNFNVQKNTYNKNLVG